MIGFKRDSSYFHQLSGGINLRDLKKVHSSRTSERDESISEQIHTKYRFYTVYQSDLVTIITASSYKKTKM